MDIQVEYPYPLFYVPLPQSKFSPLDSITRLYQ